MHYIEIHPDGTQKTAPSTHILLGKFVLRKKDTTQNYFFRNTFPNTRLGMLLDA